MSDQEKNDQPPKQQPPQPQPKPTELPDRIIINEGAGLPPVDETPVMPPVKPPKKD